MQNNWLKIGYWNIRGLKFSDGSLKTEQKAFFERIKKHDIMCFSEVQCGTENIPRLEGYRCLQLCRGINEINNCYYGGLCVFYKTYLRKGISFLPNVNTDFIWIKLCRECFGMSKDIFMCLAYFPPDMSSYYKAWDIDSLSLIEEKILNLDQNSSYVIMGDINARTGKSIDFIENDSGEGIRRHSCMM